MFYHIAPLKWSISDDLGKNYVATPSQFMSYHIREAEYADGDGTRYMLKSPFVVGEEEFKDIREAYDYAQRLHESFVENLCANCLLGVRGVVNVIFEEND